MTPRLRVTLVFEYEALPENYDTDDLAEMVAVDQAHFEDDPSMLFLVLDAHELVSIAVEPAEEERVRDEMETIEDGFGNYWEQCHAQCTQEVVRPGKVQCNGLSTDITDRKGWPVYEPCPWGNTPHLEDSP